MNIKITQYAIEKAQSPCVFGMGLIALDVITRDEKPDLYLMQAGGTCGNVLTILSYLGWNAYPIARMDSSVASQNIQTDMQRWGVKMDYVNLTPSVSAPVILETLSRKDSDGVSHSFSTRCPICKARLPRYQAATLSSIKNIIDGIPPSSVFFTDRASPSSLALAKATATRGGLVVFEPSSLGDAILFDQLVASSHILKYSQDRLGSMSERPFSVQPQLQIETCGQDGLRYRLKGNTWQYADAFPVLNLQDSCGAGDWMTAGLIWILGKQGANTALYASSSDIHPAICVSQAFASWACGFIGARGGMYNQDKHTVQDSVNRILCGDKGHSSPRDCAGTSDTGWTENNVFDDLCPSCSQRVK